MLKIGVIGYGGRISAFIDIMLKYEQGVEIAAIADINLDRVRKMLGDRGIGSSSVSLYTDAEHMLDREQLDGVLIGTRCSLHTPMAIKVMARNLPLFLEKPVAISMEQLQALSSAMHSSSSEVVVSFPLRVSTMVTLAKEMIESGKIGTVEHVQAVNNVPYGANAYFHGWYRDAKETGGLFLQKATHDLDYINALLGLRPVAIAAMKSRQIFKGNKPAGLRCVECEDYETCPESPYRLKHFYAEDSSEDSVCCFSADIKHEDSASVLIQYETGMHVSYSQNFFVKKHAASRGARLMGYKGTLEFDWYRDEMKVFMHHSERVETIKMNSGGVGHGGGDEVLAYNFIQIMRGREKSISPLSAGIMSAFMCLRARLSAETNAFQEISSLKPDR